MKGDIIVFAFMVIHVQSTRTPGQQRKRPRVHSIESMTTTTTPPPTDPTDEWEFPMPVGIGVDIVGVSARGRVEERYDMRQISRTHGESTVALLNFQQILDARYDVFTPQTYSGRMKEITQLGEVDIGQVVAKTGQEIIFELPQVPGWLIKYKANCFEILDDYKNNDSLVHPLIFDANYGHEASLYGVSMEVLFLSPPAILCPTKSGKCDFVGLTNDQYQYCRAEGGTIRYMVMRKSPGMNLGRVRDIMGGKLPFEVAMTVGATLMNLIETLHSKAKVIHGAIHEGNIMIDRNSTDAPMNYSLKLIGFGKSLRIQVNYSENPKLARHFPVNRMFSQWRIDGHELSPRDDVFGVLQVVTYLVHNYQVFHHIESHYRSLGYVGLKWFKTHENWFAPVLSTDPMYRLDIVNELNISDSTKQEIRAHLSNIMATVRGLKSPNQAIPYGAIRDMFTACAAIVVSNSSSTITTI